MSDGALLALALAFAIFGMAGFALANDGHWRQVLGDRPQSRSAQTACRVVGSLGVGLSFLVCALADPVSMAILVWPMLLGVAAALIAAFLTIHGHLARR